jgi:hypothetical protein
MVEKKRLGAEPSIHPVPRASGWKRNTMTICLGLVCNHAKNILLAADTRASYGTVTTNDQAAKIYELPAKYSAAVAGKLGQGADVVSELYHRMEQLNPGEIAPEQVRKCILGSYDQIYKTLADEALRNDPKITLDEYKHDKKLVPKIRQYAREVLKALEVDLDLIVAGFYRGLPVQYIGRVARTTTCLSNSFPSIELANFRPAKIEIRRRVPRVRFWNLGPGLVFFIRSHYLPSSLESALT